MLTTRPPKPSDLGVSVAYIMWFQFYVLVLCVSCRSSMKLAVDYKPEVCRFNFRWIHLIKRIYRSLDPSCHTMALESTQVLTEMSTRDDSWW
jgi:hypothetical protein